jgi:hypothetical protein
MNIFILFLFILINIYILKLLNSPLNNIDANFDKISDLVKKYFDDQIKTYNEKNKSNDFRLDEDLKGVEKEKKIEVLKIENYRELFSANELEDLNNLFLNYSSDEVI